ncbi:MAG TPA: hypothetical protein VEU76_09765, partial [Candidatus Udaeobacter sp.]|nr:hypothetical protein [Candidatus Udaeobacter sp.]
NFFPLVMVLWANLHGGWVIAFVWFGVAIGAEVVGWVLNRDDPAHVMHLRRLGVVTLASALAVAATPHFLALYPYPFQTEGSVAQQRLIVEWFSPDFHQPFLRPFEAMIFLVLAGFALRRPSVYDLLLTAVALFLALQSVRNIALFIAATTPVLIDTYGCWWKEFSASRRWHFELPPRALFAAITALMLVVILGATLTRLASELSPQRQQQLDASSYPVGAADWLVAHPDVGTRMYNQYGWGGYLAYRFYPDQNRRVFIFGEAALMGDPLLNQYEDVQTLRPDWKQVLDQYKVDYIVYNKGEALSNVLATQPDWKLVYEDSVAVIYVRNQ